MSLKEELKDKLTKEELSELKTSFDVIGSKEGAVAIIEIPENLKKKDKTIAKTLMKVHKNIKSVLKKESPRKGEYRLRKYRVLAGDKNTEVIHKESGCRFLLDPIKTYFSVREGTERIRISKKIKKGERVLVMFGGIAPFPIIFARKTKADKIYSVEINPEAHKYAEKNIILNKVGDKVIPILGDVREVCKALDEKFDRILMPLPESAHEFLDVAFSCSKKGTIIHLYGIVKSFEELEEKVKEISKKTKRKYKIENREEVLPYGPGINKVCLEIQVK